MLTATKAPDNQRPPVSECGKRSHHREADQPVQIAVVEGARRPHRVDEREGGECQCGPTESVALDACGSDQEQPKRRDQPQVDADGGYLRCDFDLRRAGQIANEELKDGSDQSSAMKARGVGHEPAMQPGYHAEIGGDRGQMHYRKYGYSASAKSWRPGTRQVRLTCHESAVDPDWLDCAALYSSHALVAISFTIVAWEG